MFILIPQTIIGVNLGGIGARELNLVSRRGNAVNMEIWDALKQSILILW